MRNSDLLKRRAELVDKLINEITESILSMNWRQEVFLDHRDLRERFTAILASRWQT
jgi:hypothetical protein